jgi:hypothetical protein
MDPSHYRTIVRALHRCSTQIEHALIELHTDSPDVARELRTIRRALDIAAQCTDEAHGIPAPWRSDGNHAEEERRDFIIQEGRRERNG